MRILCFGDSLTAGYSGMGTSYTPYHVILVRRLEQAFPDLKVEIEEDGVPGDVTGMYMGRILKHFGRGKKPFDWTIVLGGTNDLAYSISPTSIFENLSKTWSVALNSGSKVLALTVPECGPKGSPPNGSIRDKMAQNKAELNDLIKNYEKRGYHAFDFHATLPYHSLSSADNKRYWDDLIHLTPDGYDLMGRQIAAELVNILQNEDPQALESKPVYAVSKPKRRMSFKDDGKLFLEEDGDPSQITQGYIVVRGTDLE